MNPKEIKNMDTGTLNEKILELKKELVKINAQVATGTAIKNPGQVKILKKTMARILTIQHQKNAELKTKKIKNIKQSEVDKKHE